MGLAETAAVSFLTDWAKRVVHTCSCTTRLIEGSDLIVSMGSIVSIIEYSGNPEEEEEEIRGLSLRDGAGGDSCGVIPHGLGQTGRSHMLMYDTSHRSGLSYGRPDVSIIEYSGNPEEEEEEIRGLSLSGE
jgi:hypothetical protein